LEYKMSILLKNIRKSYGDEIVLDGVSLEFSPGITCVMGQSGIGKTTLVNILAGLVTPDSGEITGLDGLKISMVFQEDRLLEWESALSNVLFVTRGKSGGRYAVDTERLQSTRSALSRNATPAEERACIARYNSVTPPRTRAVELLTQAGLEDSIHKKAAELSGGMKRRVCLCRALIADYDLLILDEPFKGLDNETKPAIMQMLLNNAPKDKVTICITHDPAEAEFLGGKIFTL
jgi:NitT/TauT family transport system ATP-binding protein